MKISTQYLVSLLSCINDMPEQSFKPDALAACWRARGGALDERFILHYEVLFDYQFLAPGRSGDAVVDLDSLVNELETLQQPLIRLSSSGRDFLARYGD